MPGLPVHYQIGSTTLGTPSLAPTPAPSPPSGLTGAQQAANGLINLTQPKGGGLGGNISGAIVGTATGGDLNPLDLAGAGASALATDVVGVAGQAILGVLTTIGHGIANALVTFLQWAGGIAKTYVVALAVAGVVLLMLFR